MGKGADRLHRSSAIGRTCRGVERGLRLHHRLRVLLGGLLRDLWGEGEG